MKTILIENGFEQDIPSELLSFAKTKFPEYIIWENFNIAFFEENKDNTLKKFEALKTGDNILFQTYLTQFYQLELLTCLLWQFIELNKKLNIYIVYPDVIGEEFKQKQNMKFIQTVNFHNVYQVLSHHLTPELIKL
jgi:hypothetical protein